MSISVGKYEVSSENGHDTSNARCSSLKSNGVVFRHRTGKVSNVDPSVLSSIDNPYRWPTVYCNFGMSFNGVALRSDPVRDDPITHAQKLRDLPVREDDVFLLTYPKSGTHWASEILSMLLKGSVRYNKTDKLNSQLEVVDDLDSLASLQAPRFFNTHRYFAQLPRGIAEKKCKIVHVMRNPKDQAASWFHHLKRQCPQDFTVDNFLNGYTTEGYSTFSNQFEFLRQVSAFEKAHPGHPIIHIHFEDLKLNPLPVLRELAEFLDVSATDEFLQNVNEACSFENLKCARVHDKLDAVHFGIYRRGIVGDWKNTFTVAQNEYFEEFLQKQKEKGYGFVLKEP